MQDKWDAGLEGCRKGGDAGKQGWRNGVILMFALMREYISTYFYTVYDVMATNINVVL